MKMLKELFGVEQPILGMVHLPPLPGTPLYDEVKGMKYIREVAERDAKILVDAGFDGIVFSNEGDRPYKKRVGDSIVAAMSSVIYDVASKHKVPFGLSVLADPEAAISIGAAVEADFVRIFLSWVYVGDWGIVDPDASNLLRVRRNLNADKMKIIANISGHTEPLGGRKLEDIARGAVKFGLADAVCLAGATAGSEISEEDLKAARQGSCGKPVFAGTGVSEENFDRMSKLADGVIMGTSLKIDRNTFNPVDEKRAKAFIEKVKKIRK